MGGSVPSIGTFEAGFYRNINKYSFNLSVAGSAQGVDSFLGGAHARHCDVKDDILTVQLYPVFELPCYR